MIYIVEDDEHIRELVLYGLKTAGLNGRGFSTGAQLFAALASEVPKLILLDVMLPEMDGLAILARLKKSSSWQQIPVIMLTAKSDEMDKIHGLDGGADDYITKPFSVLELLSRIKAVLRRAKGAQEETVYQIGKINLSVDKHLVMVEDKAIQLTLKEFELLLFLMRNKGLVLAREQLMEAVWGFEFEGESRTVDVHIQTLRQKLGSEKKEIQTIRGIGYKMD